MAAPIYADLDDYKTWSGDTAADLPDALFARASSVVDEVLIGAVYAVDGDQQPTDTDVIDALRDATCAQVQWFDETGDTTGSGAGGELGHITSASIGSASYSIKNTGGGTDAGATQTTPSGITIAPTVLSILRAAGLKPSGVLVYG